MIKECLRDCCSFEFSFKMNPNLTSNIILKHHEKINEFDIQKIVKEINKDLFSIGVEFVLQKIENLKNDKEYGALISFSTKQR